MSASSRTRPSWRRRWRTFRRELPYRFYAGAVARDLNYCTDMTDRAIDGLEDRVAALEEIIAARWPRSAALRRQLAREIRAVDVKYAEAGRDFRIRRSEWMGTEIVLASVAASKRRQGER